MNRYGFLVYWVFWLGWLAAPPTQAQPLLTQRLVAAAVQVDINSADEKTLRTVPGIGEAYARKIIAGRPYKRKDELVKRGILPAGVYEKVKDFLVAHQKK